MADKNKLNRREFVHFAALGTGSICLLPGCIRSTYQWRFFSNSEAQLIDALAEQMIPQDEWPGGRESGVTNFIDKQLVGPYARFQSKYREGIATIQQTCEKRYRKKFEDLTWNEQTIFLEDMEAGNMTEPEWKGGFDIEFFTLVRDHSMQAFYGSPRHGGNKNNMSYKMLELDYPVIIGQNRYKT